MGLAVCAAALSVLAAPGALARERSVPRVDRDGDRRADIVVLRPNEETSSSDIYWNRSSAGFEVTNGPGFGAWPLIGDWDGDGRTDKASWVPDWNGAGHGMFAIGPTGPYVGFPPNQAWGQAGDDPTVVSDYSGDGRTDIAVFRPGSPSTWFISTGHTADIVVQWGQGDDQPVPADYDGDGRTDIAVARPGDDGTWYWYIRYSGGGHRVVQFGNVDDFIVPGDFDGDGRGDLAVTRVTGGTLTWFIDASRRGFWSYEFGDGTDYEVAQDYDGDGRTDIAVWRDTSPGRFFIMNSSNGSLRVEPWGEPGDYPLANLPVRFAPLDAFATASDGPAAAHAAERALRQ